MTGSQEGHKKTVFIVLDGADYEGYWPDMEDRPIKAYATRGEAAAEVERRDRKGGFFADVFEIALP